jgi:hypothetical protein
MKMNTFKHLSQISSQQPKLGTTAYWSVCAFAAMINSDRNPEGTCRVRGEKDS